MVQIKRSAKSGSVSLKNRKPCKFIFLPPVCRQALLKANLDIIENPGPLQKNATG